MPGLLFDGDAVSGEARLNLGGMSEMRLCYRPIGNERIETGRSEREVWTSRYSKRWVKDRECDERSTALRRRRRRSWTRRGRQRRQTGALRALDEFGMEKRRGSR